MKYVGFNSAGNPENNAFIIHEEYNIYFVKFGLCILNNSKLLFKHYTEIPTLPKNITGKILLLSTEANIFIHSKYEDLPNYKKIIHINSKNVTYTKKIL